jgi:N-acyl-L-homoserine lactone synthetase
MHEPGGVVVKVANCRRERVGFYRLRHDAYVRKGYIDPDPSGKTVDEWDELPGTIQLVALHDDTIVGGVRLVPDSEAGLPMERTFATELAALKTAGRKLAEASALVVESDSRAGGRPAWLILCEAVWQEAEARGVDDLCIAVTQDHLGLYKRLMFESMGPSKPYHTLNDVLAYPLRLRVGDVRTRRQQFRGSREPHLVRRFLDPPG